MAFFTLHTWTSREFYPIDKNSRLVWGEHMKCTAKSDCLFYISKMWIKCAEIMGLNLIELYMFVYICSVRTLSYNYV